MYLRPFLLPHLHGARSYGWLNLSGERCRQVKRVEEVDRTPGKWFTLSKDAVSLRCQSFRERLRSLCALHLVLGLILLSCVACGTIRFESPRYQPTAFITNDIGRGARVRLQVTDDRPQSHPTRLGITADIYKQPIESDVPVLELVRRAFRTALSTAGYVIIDDADVAYAVRITDFAVGWAQSFGAKATSTVSVEVRVLQNGTILANRLLSQTEEVPKSPWDNGQPEGKEVLIKALTHVVEDAVRNPQLTAAITSSQRLASAQNVARLERAPRDYGPRYKRRIAAVIGIDTYESWPPLEGAVADGRYVAAAMRQHGFDEVIEIYDGDATRERILDLLGVELQRKSGKEDLALVFFAGHGETETLPSGEKRGYIIPVDGDSQRVFSTAISMEVLRDLTNRLIAKHVYYVMDSCYSGLGFIRGRGSIRQAAGYIDKITSQRAVQMITAGQAGEKAFERGGRGLFTTYWLKAIDGDADFDGDGYVTASEIGAYVPAHVTAASYNRQTPQHGTIEGNGEIVFSVPARK